MALSREIERARNGGFNELGSLFSAVTRETFSLDVINVFLQHLHKDLCPPASSSGSNSPNPVVKNAILSLFFLPNLLNTALERSELLDDVVDAIVDAFDGIIAWINYMLLYGLSTPMDPTPDADVRQAYFANAKILVMVLNFDPRCLDALCASPAAMDVVYKIWVTTGKKGQVFQQLESPYRPCPIVSLMAACWDLIPSNRAFGRRAAARGKELSPAIFSAMVDRSCQVGRFIDAGGSIADALSYFSALCDLAAHIQADTALQQIAIEEDLLEGMGATAMSIICKADATIGLQAIRCLMYAALSPCAGKRVRNLQEIIVVGWLSRYLKFVQQPLSPDALNTAILVAAQLEVMCCTHAEIPDRLYEELEPDSSATVNKLLDHPEQRFRDQWRSLLTALRWGTEVLTGVRGARKRFIPKNSDPFRSHRGPTLVKFCDYLSCPFVFSSKSSNARKCQGCKSVVYCSNVCQRKDWGARHRNECRPAKLEYFRLSSEGAWYPHRTRAYHLDYIEGYCAVIRDADPSFRLKPALIVDFRQGTTRAARVHPGVYDLDPEFRAVTPPHIEPRFNELFGEMKRAMAGTLPDGKRLRFVEAIYPWLNGGLLSLLVKMKAPSLLPAKDMEFSTVSSVARIFYPAIQE